MSENTPSTAESLNAPGAPRDWFATTHWTVVRAAGRRSTPEADRALEELCRTYWYPVYAYVCHRGYRREDAEDLAQAFFARFLAKNYLEGLSVAHGKFRAFLLAAVKHFLANEWDRAHRVKRGGDVPHLPLDWQTADTRYQIDIADPLSPDKLYDRAWATALLERVILRLEAEAAAKGASEQFQHLKPCLMLGGAAIRYAQPAAALGMTEAAARVAVHRWRRRYRELLREELAQTLSHPEQVDEELQALFGALTA
jgi:DNA-directed RNA polymerase specialized sigma24 family protein